MGWLVLAVIGVVAVALLRWLGVARRLWSFVGAVLLLGAVGYAVQGRPATAGHPVTADATPVPVDPGLVAFRDAIDAVDRGDDTSARFALAAADAALRVGDTRGAVETMTRAVDSRPADGALWTGLGSALATHDGAVSPAAVFAFRRALRLAPDKPGPWFFLGLAYVEAGQFPAGRQAWAAALAATPKDAPYRADIAERLALVDQYIAMANAGAVRR